MSDWAILVFVTHLPPARAQVILHRHQADHEQRRQGAVYYVNVNPTSSWGDLAGELYRYKDNRAMEVFKAQLPKAKGNQCDCVECVGAVCSGSVYSVLLEVLL